MTFAQVAALIDAEGASARASDSSASRPVDGTAADLAWLEGVASRG